MAIKFLSTVQVDTDVLYVDAANDRVGIGTASPSEKLEVIGKGIIRRTGSATAHSDTDLLVTDSTAAGSTAQIELLGGNNGFSNIKFADTDSYTVGSIDYNHSSNSMSFRTNSSQNVVINSAGNVGIGTTSPGYKLEVNAGTINNIAKFESSDGGGVITVKDSGGEVGFSNIGNDIYFKTSSSQSNKMVILNSGNVGIGTTSPAHKLSVAGTFQVKDANSAVVIQEYSSGATIWMDGVDGDFVGGDYFNISAYGATDLAFGHGATTKMTLKNTGNLGIGTTSPNAKLEVDLGADGIISQFVGAGSDTLNITGQNNEILLDTRNASNGLAFGIQGSTKMVLKNSGNVGIGTTSPGYPLEVSGIIKTSTSFLGTTAIIQKVTALNTNGIQFTNNGGSEKMRITDTGNVGINKTNPGAKLDIQPTTADRKVTRIQNDVMSTYYYNSQVDAILAWTCGSYYQAEVVITANQTNGGAYNNIYIRGIWSNNHTSHHWDELERVGYLTGSTFTVSVGQNGATTASGRLELDFDYVSQSFSEMNIRVTDFYGSHTYTIT